MFRYLHPYPSGRVAAHHNRAGPAPVRHGRSTGFVHWYECIARLFKYISIKLYKNYSNEDEAVTGHLARQPATNPLGHTLEPPKSVYLEESKVRPSHCHELSCNLGSHDSNLKRPKRRRAGHRECPHLQWTFEMYISLLLIAVTNIAVGNWALIWIQVEEMWFDAGRESLDTVSWNSFQQVERDCVNKVW